jgi:uncharacterized pyridoxamine 5'-phosphate oxidase family protein
MKEVIDFLRKSQIQYLATIGLDGKPKVRPFQFMMEEDSRLYFCTSNEKKVYKEIKKQPWIEFCSSGDNFSWLRLNGKAIFSKDLLIKRRIQEANPFVKSIYKTPENPVFEVFYIEEATATFYDFSGQSPKTIKI